MLGPYRLVESTVGGPIHPGGEEATRDLLARAEVRPGVRVVDLGCGTGRTVEIARSLGADAVGVDRDGPVCGDLVRLPLADGSVDVAVSECALCLSEDLDAALAEVHRVLAPGGRLAFSDVTCDGDVEPVPPMLARILCLDSALPRDRLVGAVRRAEFADLDVVDRSADLSRFRDRVRERVDVDGLLAALGDDGRFRDAIARIEEALSAGRIGYVACVATKV